jgi:tRNA threonylcarbamoyladenosine biosynthesis protein TsaB
MLLGIRTDSPVAELYLYDGSESVAAVSWQADRELAHRLLKKIDEFLGANKQSLETLSGLFVFQGPGSFTGLRIGLTVMNTLSYALSVPIVGEVGDDWQVRAIKRLTSGENDKVVMPFYGAEARITTPKK